MYQRFQQFSKPRPAQPATGLAPRITGLEAEHAILFRPEQPGGPAPRRKDIYDSIRECLAKRGPVMRSGLAKPGVFLANSGLVQHEALPTRELEGLLEIASPECRDPLDTALYHRALEDQIAEVIPEVEEILAKQGLPGRVALGKNCTDYKGNYYGAHENYDVADAVHPALRPVAIVYIGLVWLPAAIPVALGILLACTLVALSLLVSVVSALLAVCSLVPLIGYRARRGREIFARLVRMLASRLASGAQWVLDRIAMRLTVWWNRYLIACLRPFFLRRFQRDLPGFLVTRALFSGAGVVSEDGELHLSQRAEVMGAAAGIFLNDGKRPLLDMRDLYWPPQAALARRKRLHVMVGDSNMSDLVNYMKVGTTQLILDVIEAGQEIPGTQLADPVGALQAVSQGAGNDVPVELVDGTTSSAFTVQRRYLDAVTSHFAPALASDQTQPGAERVRDLVRRWEAILDGLEANPHVLYRDLDWVCKSDLMAQSEHRVSLPGILSPDLVERCRKIDLRFHEIGPDGYYSQLRSGGLVTEIFTDAEIQAAMRQPPPGTRAQARGEIVRLYGHLGGDLAAAWSRVAGSDPVSLDVYLEDPYDGSLPPGLPPVPQSGDGPRLERVASQLPILPGGTGKASSVLHGLQVPLVLFLGVADIAVGLSLPHGGAALAVGVLGFAIMAPLVSVSLVALLRQLLGRGAFSPEDVAAAAINVAILNVAVVAVCRLVFGVPDIW